MTNYREILRLSSLGYNNTEIADVCGCSRTTVISVLRQAEAVVVGYPLPEGMSERDLINVLRPPVSGKPVYHMPDYAKVHKEYQRKCVTLNRLWLEYCEDCQKSGELPYQLTQFKKYYREYTVKAGATMHLDHKPGEIMQVDWAGDTAKVIDTDTGELIPAYLFVAVLPYSGYAYVEAFYSMDQECWTEAHVNAFRFFGGVARIIQCDNLKTGVTSHGKDEIVLNKAYSELAEHYGTAVMSYLPEEVQRDAVDIIDGMGGETFPSHAQTRLIRKQAESKEGISYEQIEAILNRKHWIIEPEAAAVVRDIFKMSMEGKGNETIARIMSERHILNPTSYWWDRGEKRGKKAVQSDPYKWKWGAQGQLGDTITEAWIRSRETSEANAKRAIAFWKKQCEAGFGDVLRAFDCSGLGMYWLQNVKGILRYDLSAHGLYNKCEKLTKDRLRVGDFVFKVNKDGKATHITTCSRSSKRSRTARNGNNGRSKSSTVS